MAKQFAKLGAWSSLPYALMAYKGVPNVQHIAKLQITCMYPQHSWAGQGNQVLLCFPLPLQPVRYKEVKHMLSYICITMILLLLFACA